MSTRFMERALELARSVKGRTSPNPAVGAVVVRDGRVVGEGATQPPGGLHAEPMALRAAAEQARGATLYVTLEPCAHQGRTPPCVDAILAAGIAAVRIATLDPNPLVAGRGYCALAAAGVEVRVGEGSAAARALNEDFACWVTTGRPLVMAKFAASLDGRIATRAGASRWITGPEARAEVHRLRDMVDAVLVGVNTVIVDDPALTARPEGSSRPPRHPLRVVLDSAGRTPLGATVLRPDLPGTTLMVTTERSSAEWRAQVSRAGSEVLLLPARNGRVPLEALFDALGQRQVTSVLVEGGATVHGALFDAQLVDRVLAFLAPMVIGGTAAPGAVAGRGAGTLGEATRLLDVEVRQIGADTLISGYVRRAPWPPPPPQGCLPGS